MIAVPSRECYATQVYISPHWPTEGLKMTGSAQFVLTSEALPPQECDGTGGGG